MFMFPGVMCGLAFAVMVNPRTGPQAQAPQTEEERITVVIRGRLEFDPTEGGGRGSPGRFAVRSRGMLFRLEFKEPVPGRPELDPLVQQAVVVEGSLEQRGEPGHLVCIVEGKVRAAADVGEPGTMSYLVAYEKGRVQEVESLLEDLGMEVRSHNETGGYFKVTPTRKAGLDYVKRLQEGPGVRFVEKEQVYRPQAGTEPR
ncbi:hypothetical protein [Tautonia plasticadhaerens]|uniref:Uncharacterized protein n=1 Tax=Tautonia plasticadhaerens TaxID=2527974 RepID=A0A518H5L3_9BACT|nr:hypothetical protein [Tautonia plasticadhaerens]QDV36125.1 hypothetical protein ElP_40390 [Tautonia plasticadhaerens]